MKVLVFYVVNGRCFEIMKSHVFAGLIIWTSIKEGLFCILESKTVVIYRKNEERWIF